MNSHFNRLGAALILAFVSILWIPIGVSADTAVNKTIVILTNTTIVITPAQGTGIAIGGIIASLITAIILCIVAVRRNEVALKELYKRTRDYYYSNKDL
jgi:hypothetical protein